MKATWPESRTAFVDAADWFVSVVDLVGGRWDAPGLGEWDVRALTGHTSRALLTVEKYLTMPAPAVDVASAADYFRAGRGVADPDDVARRGREAGSALGPDPARAVGKIASRVSALLAEHDGTEVVATIVGGMRLADYLPTRTFELVVHTADLATALDVPVTLPPTAAREALALVADLAAAEPTAAPLLMAATGRTALPPGFTVL